MLINLERNVGQLQKEIDGHKQRDFTTKDLHEENDENPDVACTSQLQKWNKKSGGENIVPQPVMDVTVKKAKLDESSTSRGGVKCLLYEA